MYLAAWGRYVNNAIRKAARLQHLQNTCLLGCDLRQCLKLLNFLVAIVNSQSHLIPVGCLAHDCWCFEGNLKAHVTFISTLSVKADVLNFQIWQYRKGEIFGTNLSVGSHLFHPAVT